MFKFVCVMVCLCVGFAQSSSTTDTISNNNTLTPLIVSGWPAHKGDVPYQVALKALVSRRKQQYKTFCSAVIIAPSKLITAAHCFHTGDGRGLDSLQTIRRASRFILKNKYAVAGNLKNIAVLARYDSDENGQWRLIKAVTYPAKYKFPLHDIAVVYTKKPFSYNKFIAPIPVASLDAEYSGKCLITGYGRATFEGKPSKLILAHLDIVPTPACNIIHGRDMKSFICSNTKLSDIGQGDSGGPLVCSNTNDPNEGEFGVLVGVISGHRRAGSFFTRVSKYKMFIGAWYDLRRKSARPSFSFPYQDYYNANPED